MNAGRRWDDLLGAAHIWQLRPETLQVPTERERWLPRLAPEERRHYDDFATARMRENYLAARVLCRATLSHYAGIDPSEWRFGAGENGKPTIVKPIDFASLRFNLTHADDLVMCIVTRRGDVGVDVEKISAAVDDRLVAQHFLSSHQQLRLASLPARERARGFFEQWVLKEAYVKATGEGLAYAPERLTIEQDEKGEPVPVANCQFALYNPSPYHVAAAAVLLQDGGPTISIDWLEAAQPAALRR